MKAITGANKAANEAKAIQSTKTRMKELILFRNEIND